MYKTIIGILPGQTENILKVCSDFKLKDSSLNYEVIVPSIPELKEKFEKLLVLYSENEEKANKLGGWFIHKCRNAKLSHYFWVKEI